MEFLQNTQLAQFLAFIPKIKKELAEWRLINISFAKETTGNIFYISKKIYDVLHDKEGQIVTCNSHELLALVKTGKDVNINALQVKILQQFPEYKCSIEIIETTHDGLQKIEMLFRQEKEGMPATPTPLGSRQTRQKNIILIADDDMFMRSLAKKVLEPYGEVTALDDADGVVDAYLKLLPDILYLDIHMPGGSGIDILNNILKFDPDAYVIMLSADSAKDNVLNTKKIGAKGFVTKPFTKEKLEEVLWKCPTFTQDK